MAPHVISRSTLRAVWAVCAGTLIASAALVPQAIAPSTAYAADDSCISSVGTYVLSPASTNPAKKRTLSKYMDWGPRAGESSFFDTQFTAQIPGTSKLFTAPNGVIYEISSSDRDAPLKAYKDSTATGGSLLTAAKTYKFDWSTAKRVWSNGKRIFVVNDDNTVQVFEQSAPATGDGTISLVTTLPRSNRLTGILNAEDVWMVGSVIYTLSTDGTIAHQTYLETGGSPGAITTSIGAPVTDKTGLTGVTQAWSPGPGAINTLSLTDDPDTTGRISKYTTGPFTGINDEVRTGVLGDVMADTASCLADPDLGVRPYFGAPPTDEGDVPVAQEPSDPAAPQPSNTVTGKFTLGNGQPAVGLQVTVTAADVVAGSDEAAGAKEPVVGTATTAADGTWSLTLQSTLPTAAQKAMDDNRGALNLNATTSGITSSGVSVLGVDALVAVPPKSATLRAASNEETAALAEAVDDGHSVPMVPNMVDDAAANDPTPEQEKRTLAAQVEADPTATDDKTPVWQSDRSTLAANYNPYLAGGKDISGEKITPRDSGTCDTWRYKQSSKIKYTVVGEAHAHWDAKASFDYEDTMNSSIDIAVNSNGDWKVGGSKQVSHETGVSTGYTNKGPYYARQYKVPIEYNKYKHTRTCSGTVRATWYTIEAGRYKVPSGGSVGKLGKDVASKDGSRHYHNSPRSHRAKVEPGTYFQLSRKKSSKFGNAVNFMGVALGVTTGYDKNHKQKITAGNRRDAKHEIWGKNGPVSDKPGVFYSF
ncbi:hypothetical protein [Streptomyces sp. NPDC057623]|uniref:hypothetical protein n=1 Tax=Streptomyces sp. NPDC057623 TaxID=3346187 RepID=UPI00367AA160